MPRCEECGATAVRSFMGGDGCWWHLCEAHFNGRVTADASGMEALDSARSAVIASAERAVIEAAIAWNARHGQGDPEDEMCAEVDMERAVARLQELKETR